MLPNEWIYRSTTTTSKKTHSNFYTYVSDDVNDADSGYDAHDVADEGDPNSTLNVDI